MGLASGASAPTVAAVEPVEPSAGGALPPDWKQTGSNLSLSLDSKSFAYRIVF